MKLSTTKPRKPHRKSPDNVNILDEVEGTKAVRECIHALLMMLPIQMKELRRNVAAYFPRGSFSNGFERDITANGRRAVMTVRLRIELDDRGML